jgi:hypothetical protein
MDYINEDPIIRNGLLNEIIKDKENISVLQDEINQLQKLKFTKREHKEKLMIKLSMISQDINFQLSHVNNEISDILTKLNNKYLTLKEMKKMVEFKQKLTGILDLKFFFIYIKLYFFKIK